MTLSVKSLQFLSGVRNVRSNQCKPKQFNYYCSVTLAAARVQWLRYKVWLRGASSVTYRLRILHAESFQYFLHVSGHGNVNAIAVVSQCSTEKKLRRSAVLVHLLPSKELHLTVAQRTL